MDKIIIDTFRAARSTSPLSQAIKVGKTIYISGQLGKNPTTGELASTIEEQTKNALLNMKIIIEEAGGNISDIVKTTIFLKNLDHVSIVNNIYSEYFPDTKPARSCIEVSRLAGGALIEIEAIGVLS